MLKMASDELGYGFNLGEIATIWRGGCLIRAGLLEEIRVAFQREPDLPNLLLDEELGRAVADRLPAWRHVVQTAVGMGIPVPAFSVSLAYYDSYRSERLPANLIQAQRDFFGAHTYERVDKPGVFHSSWE
jgi:6-phosphogluconate dehydrogenase